MQVPERFSELPEYAFPRLRRLLAGVAPGGPEIVMTIGEPRHPMPDLVAPIIAREAQGFSRYPPNEGLAALRTAIADWTHRRHGAVLDPARQILPVNGTREGLFFAAIALCPELKGRKQPVVLMPNPFYQCYGAAALAVGAEPVMVPATAETGFLPDFGSLAAEVLDRTALCYICSPANPQGAVAGSTYWTELIALAERHDFRILADECYSEIYAGLPPVGILEVCRDLGTDPERLVVFNSLSKRSSVPGLRSGFVAGGPAATEAMLRIRSYCGAPLPLPIQHASAALWADEAHVEENRRLYREKFELADAILGGMPGYTRAAAGFFLWIATGDGERAATEIYRRTGVRVLPGAYLSRDGADGSNPGRGYVRVALVVAATEVDAGLKAIRSVLEPSSTRGRVH
jgi:N-succinyldiaminopimelate aminotransferase